MNLHLIHLVSFYAVVLAWIGCAGIFMFRTRGSRDQPRRTERASIAGMVVQSISFVLIWLGGGSLSRLVLPQNVLFQLLLALFVIALVIGSFSMITAAVHTLGKQWSIQARVLEDHQLIQQGPYRIVRHPIYTGLLGLLVATGITWTDWVALVAALVFFGIGTAIRVRSEEKLLREQFGAAFNDYKRSVPAVLPIKF